jgi:transposase
MSFPKSVNSEKYIKYLKAIRAKYPGEKLALFADQLRVHWSKETKKAQAELDIVTIFNAAYSPNFNPCEGAISVCKNSIKKARLRALALNLDADVEQIIKDSAKKIEK